MNFRCLADLHHSDLYYSLQLLFEKRLECELYRPIGLDWWKEGFWHVYNHPATAEQYLGLYQGHSIPKDIHGNELPPSARLNQNFRFEDGIYYITDPTHENIVNRGITLDKFKDMQFDILISSIPAHIQPFNRLIELYQPKAKHIFQVGNAWGHQPGVKNILASTASFSVPDDINACFYHQEFDLNTYKYESPNIITDITSYIHLMPTKHQMNELLSYLPGWSGRSYGAGMEDAIHNTNTLAERMRNTGFIWHVKPGGDGYGHVAFSSAACGRPTIIKSSHYRGKLFSEILQHGVTCIDLDQVSLQEAAQMLIQIASNPSLHKQMCENVYNRFKQVVNFDQEEQKIRQFLSELR